MSIAISNKVWELYDGGGSELLCLLALGDWADDNGNCYPSIASIAKKIRVTDRYAKRLIHRLIDAGYVRVIGNQYGGAPGSTRKYRLEFPANTGGLQNTPTGGQQATPNAETGGLQGTEGWPTGAERGGLRATQTVIEPSLTVNTPSALRFDDFWSAYPRCKRKESKQSCLKVWKSKKLDLVADQIIAHVKAKAGTDDWIKQEGQFIPAPLVYLNKGTWDGADLESLVRSSKQEVWDV